MSAVRDTIHVNVEYGVAPDAEIIIVMPLSADEQKRANRSGFALQKLLMTNGNTVGTADRFL